MFCKIIYASLLLCTILSGCTPATQSESTTVGATTASTENTSITSSSSTTTPTPSDWADPVLEQYLRYHAENLETELNSAYLESITSIRIEPDASARMISADPYTYMGTGLPLECAVYINDQQIGTGEEIFRYTDGTKQITTLTDLQKLPNLRELEIVWSNITELPSETVLSQLEILVLDGAELTDLAPLKSANNLRVLSLSWNDSGEQELDTSVILSLTDLEVLRLAGALAPADGLEQVFCDALPQLHSVDFRSVWSINPGFPDGNRALGNNSSLWNDPLLEYAVRLCLDDRYGNITHKLSEITDFVITSLDSVNTPSEQPNFYIFETNLGSCCLFPYRNEALPDTLTWWGFIDREKFPNLKYAVIRSEVDGSAISLLPQ